MSLEYLTPRNQTVTETKTGNVLPSQQYNINSNCKIYEQIVQWQGEMSSPTGNQKSVSDVTENIINSVNKNREQISCFSNKSIS